MIDALLYFWILLFGHWVADFVFTTHEMSLNKGKSVAWLSLHCAVYTVTMMCFYSIFGRYLLPHRFDGLDFSVITGVSFVSHFAIDYVTSRVNARLWQKDLKHYFFVSIGFDQFLHQTVILLTVIWLFSKG